MRGIILLLFSLVVGLYISRTSAVLDITNPEWSSVMPDTAKHAMVSVDQDTLLGIFSGSLSAVIKITPIQKNGVIIKIRGNEEYQRLTLEMVHVLNGGNLVWVKGADGIIYPQSGIEFLLTPTFLGDDITVSESQVPGIRVQVRREVSAYEKYLLTVAITYFLGLALFTLVVLIYASKEEKRDVIKYLF